MDITYAGILLALGILAFVIGQFLVKTVGTRKTLNMVAIAGIAIGAFGFIAPNVLPILGTTIGTGVQTQTVVSTGGATSGGGVVTVCSKTDPVTVTLSAVDFYTDGATGGTHRYRLNGNPALTVSDAGTFTATPGDKIEILWLNASTTGSFFSDVTNDEIACASTDTISKKVYSMTGGQNLTLNVYNEEGNLIDNTGENETLAAGDTVTLKIELKGIYKRAYPYGGVIVAEYNTTTYDDVILNLGGSEISTPSFYSINVTGNKAKTFTFPAVLSNDIKTGTIYLDVDDTNDPLATSAGSAGSAVASQHDVRLTIHPYNYFINEDTGSSYDGPSSEDEDDQRTFTSTGGNTVILQVD